MPTSRKKPSKAKQVCRDCAPLSAAQDRSYHTVSHWLEAGGMLIAVLAGYWILKSLGIFAFSPDTEGVLGLGTIFLVGIAASMSSCLALVGGLLLSVSAKWCAMHQRESAWHKLEPLLLFNIGRVVGYFVLGGVIALLGASLGLSVKSTAFLTIVLALVMLWLGLNILNILPKRFCSIPLPKSLRKHILALEHSRHPLAPVLFGALTFFIPCGFTQSMQLLALGAGSFMAGATIMFVFALGTLPALLSISVVSSLADGKFGRYFFKFSGALVLLLAILNLQSGLTLAGFNVDRWMPFRQTTASATDSDPFVSIDDNGKQIISVHVSDNGYSPNTFSIEPGITTWVYATAPKALSGCTSELNVPGMNLRTPVKKGGNWLGPIINPTRDFTLSCSMGMYRAQVYVKPS